jgi:uncharacterized protein
MTERTCTHCHAIYHVADQSLPNAARDYTPFCSKRCADVDLLNWLKGSYVINDEGTLSADEDIEPDQELLSPPFDADTDQ